MPEAGVQSSVFGAENNSNRVLTIQIPLTVSTPYNWNAENCSSFEKYFRHLWQTTYLQALYS